MPHITLYITPTTRNLSTYKRDSCFRRLSVNITRNGALRRLRSKFWNPSSLLRAMRFCDSALPFDLAIASKSADENVVNSSCWLYLISSRCLSGRMRVAPSCCVVVSFSTNKANKKVITEGERWRGGSAFKNFDFGFLCCFILFFLHFGFFYFSFFCWRHTTKRRETNLPNLKG
jgi:hypothetical protein